MRFGGLIAIDDLSFQRRARRDHRHHRPQRRRQDHGLQLHHRLLQADQRTHGCCASAARRRPTRWPRSRARAGAGVGPPAGGDLPAGAHARLRDRGQGPRRPHLPEHPPVLRHDGAGEPDRRAAQRADGGLGLDGAGPVRRCAATARPRRARSSAPSTGSTRVGLIDRADDPAGDLPYGAQRRLEIARAMCTEPVLLCLDEPAAGLNPRETADLNAVPAVDPGRARHLDPADRARHVGGDGDLRPRRRARVRQQDLRRHARARAQRSQGDRRLPRRRGRGGRRRSKRRSRR